MNQLISISELIDQSWIFYRSNLRSFMKCSAWLLILAVLYIVALLFYPDVGTLSYQKTLTQVQSAGVILFALTNFLISPLLGFGVFVAVARAASATTSRTNIISAIVWHETKSAYLRAIVVTVMVGLMLFLAQVITLGPAVVIGIIGAKINNAPLLVLANLAFVVGLFVSLILTSRWTVYYMMAPYAAVLDGATRQTALQKSRSLIQGRFWSVLVRVIVPKFVFILFGLFIGTLLTLFVQFLIQGSVGLDLNLALRLNTLAASVIPIVIAVLLNPLLILSDVLLYASLKRGT